MLSAVRVKFIVHLAAAVAILCLPAAAMAGDWSQTIQVYQTSWGGTVNWAHTYDFSLGAPMTATLTIVADDVDLSENIPFSLQDGAGTWHDLGYLARMASDMGDRWAGPGNPLPGFITTSVFTLDPSWVRSSMPARVVFGAPSCIEVETSRLDLHFAEAPAVPEPSTLVLLASGGLAAVGSLWRKRKHS
jgi:hypothetical protein